MDQIRQLGALVLDHRFRRLTEQLLQGAETIYAREGLPFRPRWTSTFWLLESGGTRSITEVADQLRLTHPAIILILEDMARAGLVSTLRDRDDGRRRLVRLTAKGRLLAPRLREIWQHLAQVQLERFTEAGCDILTVMEQVETSLAPDTLADAVLARLTPSTTLTGS